MFKRILVTLDGSRLAEAALAPAFAIAQRFEAEVVLMRAVPTAELELAVGSGQAYYDLKSVLEEQDLQAAHDYLAQVRDQWRGPGVRVRLEAAVGAPPNAIIMAASRLGADLLVMSTHGRSGLSRLIYGSVAEAVLRAADTPVMLVPVRSMVEHS